MSVRLYVKLPKAAIEKENFEGMFSEFEPSFSTKLIRERKKKECRGFGFVTVPTDEAAEEFISKYNEKPFIYNGEVYKDEDGSDFILLIEKALPRKNNTPEGEAENATTSDEEQTTTTATPTSTPTLSNDENKPRRNENKGKKGRKNTDKSKTSRSGSVSQSVQPDPRWADELNKLKEMFATQTSS